MNPFDVIKQRMQLHGSTYTSLSDCAKQVFRNEGFRAFYVSYPTTLTMTVPFTALQFTAYESLTKVMQRRRESGLRPAYSLHCWRSCWRSGCCCNNTPRRDQDSPPNERICFRCGDQTCQRIVRCRRYHLEKRRREGFLPWYECSSGDRST